VANRGVAGVPGVLWIQIESVDRKWKKRGTLDAGHPFGGGIRDCSFLLPKGFSVNVYLNAEIEIRPGVLKPVAWASEQSLNSDGSITVQLQGENTPGWSKGV
jgi:hypothetical protein